MLLAWLLPCLCLMAADPMEEGWQALLADKGASACRTLGKVRKGIPALAAMEGLYQQARLQEDRPAAWEAARQQLQESTSLAVPLGLLFLERFLAESRILHRQLRSHAVLEGLTEIRAPALRQAVNDRLHANWLHMRFSDKARRLERADGRIRQWSRLIAPFRTPTGLDLALPYAPEADLSRAVYTDPADQTITPLSSVPCHRDGSCQATDLVPHPPVPALAYWVYSFESAKAQDVLLVIQAGSFRAWLNQQLVLTSDHFRFAPPRRDRRCVVRLTKGRQQLAIKVPVQESLMVQLLQTNGTPLVHEPLPVASPHPLGQIAGVLLSQEPDRSVRAWIQSAPVPEPVRQIWLRLEAQHAADPDSHRHALAALAKAYPESPVILRQLAAGKETALRWNLDSPTRLRKEAEAFYQRILQSAKDNPAALCALANAAVDNHQPETALRRLKSIAAPQPVTALYALAKLHEEKGWLASARTLHKQCVKAEPGFDLPYARYLARRGYIREATAIYEKAWQDRRISLWTRWNRCLVRQAYDEAEALLTDWHRTHPTRRRTYQAMALQLARARGDWKRVESILEQQLKTNPETIDLPLRLAEVAMEQGRKEEGTRWLQTARLMASQQDRLNPDLDRRIREHLGERWPLRQYDIDIRDLPSAAVQAKDHPEADYAILLRLVVRRIHADRSQESLVHNALKVLNRSGQGKLSELKIPRSRKDLLYCRTIQPDGTVLRPSSNENTGKDMSMYGVKPGSILEYAYRQSGRGGREHTFDDTFINEAFQIPMVRSRYCLIVPTALLPQLSIKVTPETMLPLVETKGPDTILLWDQKEKPGREPEQHLPVDRDTLATIRVRLDGGDLQKRPGWLHPPRPVASSGAIETEARRVTADLKTDREKVEAIHAWITREIKEGHSARTARDTYALRAADEGGRIQLARAMIHTLGLKTRVARTNPALLHAGRRTAKGRAAKVSHFGNPSLLHVLLPEEPDLWLRFHTPGRHYRSGDIGYNLIGAPVLEPSEDGLYFNRVRSDLLENIRESHITIALAEDGSATVQGTLIYRGSYAGAMRGATEDPQQGPQRAEQIVRQFFPRLNLEHCDLPTTDGDTPLPRRDPFIIRFRGQVREFCQTEKDSMQFLPSIRPSGASSLLVPLPRKNGFTVPHDFRSDLSLTFVAPRGWGFSHTPPDRFFANSQALFFQDINVQGRTLTYNRLLWVPQQALTPTEYIPLSNLLGDARDCEQLSISLKPLTAVHSTETLSLGAFKPVEQARYRARYWPKGLPDHD